MKAIIPAGGRGSRMQPVTFSANKHFVPVANKPLIFYPIETIAGAGVKEVAITYNPGFKEAVKNLLGTGTKWGLKFTYILQEKPLGLANIFQVCENFLSGDRFLMHLGDNIFTEGIKDYVDYFLREKSNGLVTMVHHPENWRLGVPYFDKKGRLKKYVEKPKRPPHDYAIPGLYFLDNNVFKCFKGKDKIKPSARGEYEISSPYQWLIDHGYRVDVLEYKGKWLDPGKFDDWLEANRVLLDLNVSGETSKKFARSVRIQGRVAIGKNCKIRNSTIRGPVKIGNNVEIVDSFVGPYTSIYHDCKITECRISNSILMEGVIIRNVHRLIDSSILGPHSEITTDESSGDQLEFFLGAKSEVIL